MTAGTVLRFHALRALQRVESRDGTVVVPWKLVVGLRSSEADELHAILQLCHSAVTQNRASGCFMNASTWAVMWSCTYLAEPARALGGLREVVDGARRVLPGTFRLMDTHVFRTFCRYWGGLAQGVKHQDGAEFCADALHRITGIAWGQYAERCQGEMPSPHSMLCPIPLQLPDTAQDAPLDLQA